MSIHHVQLWVPDLDGAQGSWSWLLGELGYELERRWDRGFVWQQGATAIVIESSPDMVPGMLHSRLRPGMNHIAFHVPGTEALARLVDASAEHGWTPLSSEAGHPLAPSLTAAYLENTDGFEVELIAPADTGANRASSGPGV